MRRIRLAPEPRTVPEAVAKLDAHVDGEDEDGGAGDTIGRARTLLALKPFVFGRTPLTASLRQALELYKSRDSRQRVLVIVSRGAATDDPEGAVAAAQELKRLGVTIVGCFLTDAEVPDPKRAHFEPESEWTEGARALFKMSSAGFRNVDPPVSLLSRAGWSVPDEGECSLFFRTNRVEDVSDCLTVVQTGLLSHDDVVAIVGEIN